MGDSFFKSASGILYSTRDFTINKKPELKWDCIERVMGEGLGYKLHQEGK